MCAEPHEPYCDIARVSTKVELSFGWEASTHFAVMPFKYDFSASYSWMQRDECFESLGARCP
eukprot:2154556-Amphidinium_carterae.1